MKRILCIALLISLSISLSACGNKDEKKDFINARAEDAQFYLDGEIYQLPMAMNTMLDNGWEIDTLSKDKEVSGLGYGVLDMNKDDMEVHITTYNFDTIVRNINECVIIGINISSTKVNKEKFAFGENFTFETPINEIEAYLGESHKTTNDIWYIEDVEYSIAQNDDTLTAINIKKRDSGEKYMHSTNKDTGEIINPMDEYVAPEVMSSSLYDGIILLDGKLYQLPIPMELLIEDGFQFYSNDTDIVAGQQDLSNMFIGKNEDDAFMVTLYNQNEIEVPLEKSLVTEIEIDDITTTSLELSKGIKISSTKSKIEEAYGKPTEITNHVNSNGQSYVYRENENDFYKYFRFSMDGDGNIFNIILSNTEPK